MTTLPPNYPGIAHPLHGSGWLAKWDVVTAEETLCELKYDHPAGDWPWAFRARQAIEIIGDILRMTLSVENLSDEDMPSGLGQHPYFPYANQARLQFSARSVWTADQACIPKALVPVPHEWDFTDSAPVAGKAIDHCFVGWDGTAQISWTDNPLTIGISTSPQQNFAVLYINSEENFFCFEPVTHMNNAIQYLSSNTVTGLQALKPKQIQTFITEYRAMV
ncbi:hypothetical protein AB8615_10900 [Litorimonas sp. RW-G-Af-16]|uniref:aldose epimerase family protein n=1 Tax=Litorimonas sp. RW-G-Af-16 TaxID=3241168 RepID=UPI003AAD2E0B